MKLIVELLYLVAWVFVKTGETVQKIPSSLVNSANSLSLPKIKTTQINLSFPVLKNKKHKKIKNKKVLFKAKHHKKTPPLLIYFSKLFRSLSKIIARSINTLVGIPVRALTSLLHVIKNIHVPRPHKRGKKIKAPAQLSDAPIIKYKRPSVWYSIKLFFWGIIFSSIFVFLPLLSLIFLSDLPNPSSISTSFIPKTTKIYDRNGVLLYEIFANQNRTVVELSQIPKHLRNATIAIEDREFYKHPGFDIRGISRALYSNAQHNSLQGGSTITQQLVKSALLTPEPTITRKVKELVLAFWAERIYTKDEILALYFNYVPYGGTAWGVSAASEVYFGKKIEDLDLAESAFLAGLPRAPSIYSPYAGTGDVWKKRQKQVLEAMEELNYISTKQKNDALAKELTFIGPNTPIKAPHFVMYVKEKLIQEYGLSEVERGGLQVTTTLDITVQNTAQEIVASEVEANRHLNLSNGASLILNPKNGDILAMVGSKDYFDLENDGNVNLVTSLRQPGSTAKIITYSLALATGYTQASLIDDSPFTIRPQGGEAYTPVNYDGKFRGRVPLRLAFANSLNIPAVRVAEKLGVENIVNHGKRLGITTWDNPERYGLSITLGGAETTMMDITTVYATFANSGKRIDPSPILEVKDSTGKTIFKKTPIESQVIDPGIAFIVSDILSDDRARSMGFGPNSALNIPGHRVSVKTGTTDQKRDNWAIGYTDDVVVATWVGNNDNSPMSQQLASGISGATPMWNRIMTKMLEGEKEDILFIPEDVVKKNCFGGEVYFLQGTENVPCVMPSPITPSPGRTAGAVLPL
ncbi:MAG: PBP1A family penicillin-binding protein [Candidatus Levybacteria bacterium]|nr:PBP1A family penicillin-binding protein [Candidatus Levybacteria bacterium]